MKRDPETEAKSIIANLEALGVKVPTYDEEVEAAKERAAYAALRVSISDREQATVRIGRWFFSFTPGTGVVIEDYFGALPFPAVLAAMVRLLGLDGWAIVNDEKNRRVMISDPRA
jgi:hypothetical protein